MEMFTYVETLFPDTFPWPPDTFPGQIGLFHGQVCSFPGLNYQYFTQIPGNLSKSPGNMPGGQ